MFELLEWARWSWTVWTWLITPSVAPLAGVVAALCAAVTIETRSWFKAPSRCATRVVRVATVWLLLAAGISIGVANVSGRDGDDLGKTDVSEAPFPTGETETAEGPVQIPDGMPPHVVIIIEFLPSPGNPLVALPFACSVTSLGTSSPEQITIRGKDMPEMARSLRAALQKVQLPDEKQVLTALVRRTPSPGEAVLRRIEQILRLTLPEVTVEFDECNTLGHKENEK